MSADPYSERVRELFANPAHAGDLPGAARAHVEDQGVRIALSALCEHGRLRALRFRAWGCPHLIAAADLLCERLTGETVDRLENHDLAHITRELCMPAEKTGRILLLEDALATLHSQLDAAGT